MNVLNQKAWVILTIIVAPLIIGWTVGIVLMMKNSTIDFVLFMQAGAFLNATLFCGWLYLIDRGLKRKLDDKGINKDSRLIRPFCLYLLGLNILLFAVYAIGIFTNKYDPFIIHDYFVPFGLIAMFGFFYCLKGLIDKLLTLENKDKWGLGDYFENGIIILMYPFGIWSFQKRLKRIDE